MKTQTSNNHPLTIVRCSVVAGAVVRVRPGEVAGLRTKPGVVPRGSFSPSLLKYSDEQTVVGVAAVLKAIQQHGLSNEDFSRWGAIGSPFFLGRAGMIHTMSRLSEEGVWGVSPHLIPHRMLHSLSGTVSQILKMHGPNYGVGGGPRGMQEALVTVGSLISQDNLPGLWLVLTAWEQEPLCDDRGTILSQDSICLGVALGLVPTTVKNTEIQLHITGVSKPDDDPTTFPLLRLAETLELLVHQPPGRTTSWVLSNSCRLEYSPRVAARTPPALPNAVPVFPSGSALYP